MNNMATSTWIADGAHGNLASTAANWDTPPAAGRDILFNASSVVNCTFDLTLALGAYLQNTGYSGVVTQAASFSVTSFALVAGTWTPNTTYTLTNSGNFTASGGAISNVYFNMIMTGDGTTLSCNSNYFPFGCLTINANVATWGPTYMPQVYNAGSPSLVVAIGKTLTLGAGGLVLFGRACQQIANSGTIAGTGTLIIQLYTQDATMGSLGIVTAPVEIVNRGDSPANRKVTLGADVVLGGALTVDSGHATYTMELHHGSNYILTVAGAVVQGTRGLITQGTGRWTWGSFTQSGASSIFTQGGFLIVEGTATISNGTNWAVNENGTVDALTQSGGVITVATGKVLYYEKTLSQTGGSSTGTIAQFQARKQPPIQPAANRPVDVTNL